MSCIIDLITSSTGCFYTSLQPNSTQNSFDDEELENSLDREALTRAEGEDGAKLTLKKPNKRCLDWGMVWEPCGGHIIDLTGCVGGEGIAWMCRIGGIVGGTIAIVKTGALGGVAILTTTAIMSLMFDSCAITSLFCAVIRGFGAQDRRYRDNALRQLKKMRKQGLKAEKNAHKLEYVNKTIRRTTQGFALFSERLVDTYRDRFRSIDKRCRDAETSNATLLKNMKALTKLVDQLKDNFMHEVSTMRDLIGLSSKNREASQGNLKKLQKVEEGLKTIFPSMELIETDQQRDWTESKILHSQLQAVLAQYSTAIAIANSVIQGLQEHEESREKVSVVSDSLAQSTSILEEEGKNTQQTVKYLNKIIEKMKGEIKKLSKGVGKYTQYKGIEALLNEYPLDKLEDFYKAVKSAVEELKKTREEASLVDIMTLSMENFRKKGQ